MSKLLVTTVLLLLSLCCAHAQHIKRKGTFGVSFYQKTPDSIIQKLHYRQGAVVQFAVPGTTAAALGLRAYDIITRINSTIVLAPNDIFTGAKNLRELDPIEVQIIREGQPATLKGKMLPRPEESSPTADVIYGEFAYKNGYVRTIFKTLKGVQPIGTIYFLQGLPCYSMDNFKDADITKQAIDAMVARGFAVYRMEKADLGDNVNMPPCEEMGFNEELEMYRAGYAHLLTLKQVDTSKIFLFGHSMGGITAPLLAAQFQPRGVVVYGTVFKPWLEYLFDAFLLQSQYYGEDLAKLRSYAEVMKPYIYDYFYNKIPAATIAQSDTGRWALEQLISYDTATGLAASGRSPLCHKELNQHNMAEAWKNTQGGVLAIYGECDIAAIHPDDHVELIRYVNKVHPGKGTFWLAPGTTHMFEEIGSMDTFLKWQERPEAYYRYAATKFNGKVFDYACNWMKDNITAGKP